MNSRYLTTLSVAALVAAGVSTASVEPLKVGVLATLEGTYIREASDLTRTANELERKQAKSKSDGNQKEAK